MYKYFYKYAQHLFVTYKLQTTIYPVLLKDPAPASSWPTALPNNEPHRAAPAEPPPDKQTSVS